MLYRIGEFITQKMKSEFPGGTNQAADHKSLDQISGQDIILPGPKKQNDQGYSYKIVAKTEKIIDWFQPHDIKTNGNTA